MVDFNAELKKSLAELSCPLVYQHPSGFNRLPAVSYYNLTECMGMVCDNEELIQDGAAQIDIWCAVPEECAKIAEEINGLLTADGWSRQFSMDIPKQSGERAYHRTMRYNKSFVIQEEKL